MQILLFIWCALKHTHTHRDYLGATSSPQQPPRALPASGAVPIFKEQLLRKAGICFAGCRLQSSLGFLSPHPIPTKRDPSA